MLNLWLIIRRKDAYYTSICVGKEKLLAVVSYLAYRLDLSTKINLLLKCQAPFKYLDRFCTLELSQMRARPKWKLSVRVRVCVYSCVQRRR